MKLSIVATLYHSSTYLTEFHQRASAVAKQFADIDYEIILVNDGSPDNSLEIAIQLAESDKHVVVVDLSRNFGHHKAMMTGLATAQGDYVFLIDSDLEEEPEWLLNFAKQMQDDASDVVYGVQRKRKGGFFEKLTGHFFYKIFRSLTGLHQPNNIVTARLMSKRYVDALLTHKERELFIAGLWIVTGFKQSHQSVRKHATSPTTYSFQRKLAQLVTAIISFSNRPLFFTFYTGLLTAVSSLIYVAYLTASYIFVGITPESHTSIIASIWFFSGLIIFFIGVQGLYLATIFSEVKQRPSTIIRQIYRQNEESKNGS